MSIPHGFLHDRQFLILDTVSMEVVETCESLFAIAELKENLLEFEPILNSILTLLPVTESDLNKQIRIFGVRKEDVHLSGYFDYYFLFFRLEGKIFLLWNVVDRSQFYIHEQESQQQKNEYLLNQLNKTQFS
jgi:hypothetical protein